MPLNHIYPPGLLMKLGKLDPEETRAKSSSRRGYGVGMPDIKLMVSKYKEGRTISQISLDYGYSRNTVRKYLTKAGLL